MNQKSPGWMLKQTVKTVGNSVNFGWGPIFCISKEFPDDADAIGPGTKLEEPLAQYQRASVYQGQAT